MNGEQAVDFGLLQVDVRFLQLFKYSWDVTDTAGVEVHTAGDVPA